MSFEIQAGHCHALLGENGAGKSTLGKIIAGIHAPSEGTLYLDGRPVQFSSPLDAVQAGIGMVHQELCFCPNLTVAENLCLGSLPTPVRISQPRGDALPCPGDARRDRRRHRRRPADRSLSTGQEQMVQIAGAVGTGARIIVMDEPTSSLASAEARAALRADRPAQGRAARR